MKQIQQFQEQQPNWQQLPPDERQTNENQVPDQPAASRGGGDNLPCADNPL